MSTMQLRCNDMIIVVAVHALLKILERFLY